MNRVTKENYGYVPEQNYGYIPDESDTYHIPITDNEEILVFIKED